jgi:hypothetical protein
LAQVQQANESLSAAFSAAANVGNPQDLELILRPQKHSRGSLAAEIKDVWRGLRGLNHEQPVISELSIATDDPVSGEEKVLDLLADRMVVVKSVAQLDEQSRAVDPASAFAAIHEAYEEVALVVDLAPAVAVADV